MNAVEARRLPSAAQVAQIRRGATRLAARLRAERPAEALSGNKIAVLGHLHRRGVSSPSAIAAATHQQPQSLTRVFGELRLAGLVTRRPDPDDGRGYLLEISARGRSALQADMRQRDRFLAGAIAQLSPDEWELLVVAGQLMERLADAERPATTARSSRRAVS